MTGSQSPMSYGHIPEGALPVTPSEMEKLPRYERKKAQTRERIYRAALKLFADRGLAATTVDQIVEAADVAKGTFFNYFRSKEEIFSLLIQIQLGKVAGAAEEARKGGQTIRDVLHQAFRDLGVEVGSSPNLARALVSAILGSDVARETVAAGMAEGRRWLSKVLRLGQKRGQVRKDRNPRDMSLAFQQALFGTLVLWAIRPQTKLTNLLDTTFEDYWACIEAGKGMST